MNQQIPTMRRMNTAPPTIIPIKVLPVKLKPPAEAPAFGIPVPVALDDADVSVRLPGSVSMSVAGGGVLSVVGLLSADEEEVDVSGGGCVAGGVVGGVVDSAGGDEDGVGVGEEEEVVGAAGVVDVGWGEETDDGEGDGVVGGLDSVGAVNDGVAAVEVRDVTTDTGGATAAAPPPAPTWASTAARIARVSRTGTGAIMVVVLLQTEFCARNTRQRRRRGKIKRGEEGGACC